MDTEAFRIEKWSGKGSIRECVRACVQAERRMKEEKTPRRQRDGCYSQLPFRTLHKYTALLPRPTQTQLDPKCIENLVMMQFKTTQPLLLRGRLTDQELMAYNL